MILVYLNVHFKNENQGIFVISKNAETLTSIYLIVYISHKALQGHTIITFLLNYIIFLRNTQIQNSRDNKIYKNMNILAIQHNIEYITHKIRRETNLLFQFDITHCLHHQQQSRLLHSLYLCGNIQKRNF